MASVRLDQLEKVFPNGHAAVCDLNLDVANGELLVLVGPSGCGKTTTLRLVAGLETPTRGHIFIGNRDVTGWPPRDRDVAMVFQNYALYPHLTVRQNLEFGLRVRKVHSAEVADRVRDVSRTLGLEPVLERRPAQLSGGQRQRVALGRAIVRRPQVFLLDEPLSNLDAQLRVQTRAELARMHRQLGATMLHVTHDQEEALTLGDRVAVMHQGRLQQVAPPGELYLRPANRFVAGFIGAPAMNFFPCTLRPEEGRPCLQSPFFELALPAEMIRTAPSGSLELGVRPQDVQVVELSEADVRARVDVIQPLGSETVVHLRVHGDAEESRAIVVVAAGTAFGRDEVVGLHFRRDRLHFFDGATGNRFG